ncbi:MAG: hypothetical protein WKF67_11310 [Rubrobacteraceae bacterium]
MVGDCAHDVGDSADVSAFGLLCGLPGDPRSVVGVVLGAVCFGQFAAAEAVFEAVLQAVEMVLEAVFVVAEDTV